MKLLVHKSQGKQQKRILELLTKYPNSTILELGQLVHGKPISPGTSEYNSICRSLHALKENGLVEKEPSQVKWHRKPQ